MKRVYSKKKILGVIAYIWAVININFNEITKIIVIKIKKNNFKKVKNNNKDDYFLLIFNRTKLKRSYKSQSYISDKSVTELYKFLNIALSNQRNLDLNVKIIIANELVHGPY